MSVAWLGSMAPLAISLIVAVGIGLLLLIDLLLAPGASRRWLAGVALATLGLALVATFTLDVRGTALGGTFVSEGAALFFQRLFLTGGLLTVLGAEAWVAERSVGRIAEHWALLLTSVLGMCLLAGVRDAVLLVVAFELMGMPLSVLAAWERKQATAVEGALKLYLVGAVSTAATLLGVSFLFGLAGSTGLVDIAKHVAAHPSPAALVGIATALAGMGFKLGVFPFHMWVPDTYQGAPTPFVAFLSTAPKAAGLAALVQILLARNGALLADVLPLVLSLVAATLIIGNLLAVRQSNVKRLLGYSGVAHMGFLLLALAVGQSLGLGMLLFYLLGYLFSNVGAFLVVHAVKTAGGDDTVASFDGLVRRNGFLAMCMLAFLLSLAGIPFVVGFWAKLFVFVAAWRAGFSSLVVLGAILSVLGLFYYLRVVRAMFMNPAARAATPTIDLDQGTGLAIVLCLGFVVAMGVAPGWFLAWAQTAATSLLG